MLLALFVVCCLLCLLFVGLVAFLDFVRCLLVCPPSCPHPLLLACLSVHGSHPFDGCNAHAHMHMHFRRDRGTQPEPNRTEPNRTEPNRTEPNRTEPNRTHQGALRLAMETADAHGANLVLANDPDADRLAVAERTATGWHLFNGNDVGVILGHWQYQKFAEVRSSRAES